VTIPLSCELRKRGDHMQVCICLLFTRLFQITINIATGIGSQIKDGFGAPSDFAAVK
jgi:hypothetical protein